MRVYSPPVLPRIAFLDKTVFLAGSIEMDSAPKWQQDFIDKCSFLPDDWVFLNPRRKEWDNSIVQSIENPHFYQQVDWEMTYLEQADHRVFYFAPGTMSPITLLELGKYGSQYSAIVVCPEGYLRKGNVEIFCHKHSIPFYDNLEQVVNQFRNLATQ